MTTSAAVKEWSLAEVASHNKITDCWIIINHHVFDVTSFLPYHPAGSRIVLLHGGRDCTAAFHSVHSASYITSFLTINDYKGTVKGTMTTTINTKFTGRYVSADAILSLKRTIYSTEHEQFRQQFRQYIRHQLSAAYAGWENKGSVAVDVVRAMFTAGYYCRLNIPTQYGGCGITDWRYNATVCEELENNDIGSFFVNLGNDMVLSYFTQCCTPTQQAHWLPSIVYSRAILAIAMSEPELGSDLGALATSAIRSVDGKMWTLNGRKMWISMGEIADIVVVSAVTDPSKKHNGISLFAIPTKGTRGFAVAKRFAKIGKHASDTCLLTLDNVEVPASHLLGVEGHGFRYMMSNLSKERLSIAVGSIAAARRCFALTLTYIHGRQMFGGVEAQLQSVQQRCASIRVAIQSCTSFIDACIDAQSRGELSAETASMAKVAATELANQVANECLQMFGGYGYLKNNPVAKLFVDQRVTKICKQTLTTTNFIITNNQNHRAGTCDES